MEISFVDTSGNEHTVVADMEQTVGEIEVAIRSKLSVPITTDIVITWGCHRLQSSNTVDQFLELCEMNQNHKMIIHVLPQDQTWCGCPNIDFFLRSV